MNSFFKNIIKEKNGNLFQLIFFTSLFVFLIFIMKNAFSVDFFLDDFFFLKVGKADSIIEFINFFSPIKDYFYRPIPTELFYLIINLTQQNLFIAHSIVFIFYFIGLIFLFKSSEILTKNRTFSYIFIFIYAISYTHVFQLYQLATFIEIALFTFLSISFYFYLKKKYLLSFLFFIFALMSKETAVLFPILLFLYEVIFNRKIKKHMILRISLLFIISAIFVLIYKHATSSVLVLENYKIIMDPKLILNNSIWYLLWGLGIPNFVPNYIQSIFFKPTPDFWNLLSDDRIRFYFYILILYYSLLIPLILIIIYRAKRNAYKLISALILLGVLFFIFLAPTIPTIHRWIVRLTIPMIFISAIYAVIIYLSYKRGGFVRFVSLITIILYFVLSSISITIHEQSGLFLMNSQTIKNFRSHLTKNEEAIKNFNTIYFVSSSDKNYGGSIELKNMLGSYYFTDTFFPNENKIIIYGHDERFIPRHSFVIESKDIAQW